MDGNLINILYYNKIQVPINLCIKQSKSNYNILNTCSQTEENVIKYI